MVERFKTIKSFLPAFFTIALFYIFVETIGITCPIKYITGISCAGCGMSRAWLCAFRGDINGAFYYHPLFFFVPIIGLLWFFSYKIPARIRMGLIIIFTVLFLVVYIIRLIDPGNDIVVFHPYESIFVKVFFYLKNFNV